MVSARDALGQDIMDLERDIKRLESLKVDWLLIQLLISWPVKRTSIAANSPDTGCFISAVDQLLGGQTELGTCSNKRAQPRCSAKYRLCRPLRVGVTNDWVSNMFQVSA